MERDVVDFDFTNPEHKLRILDIEFTIRDVLIEEEFRQEIEEIDKTLRILSTLSDEEKKRLALEINAQAEKHSPNVYTVPFAWMKQMIESISSEKNEFFQGIDLAEEFGVSRVVGDKMIYLHRLLDKENIGLDSLGDGSYLIHSKVKNSKGDSIGFEHRFRATNPLEADRIYEEISSRLSGVLLKVFLACWKFASRVQQFTFSCKLTDLMGVAYPNRKGYFPVQEKTEFYESLKSLEYTKFIFSSPMKLGKRKKALFKEYEIPFLVITERLIAEGAKYPKHICISILNSNPLEAINKEKLAYRGAAFKNAPLELNASDTYLAL